MKPQYAVKGGFLCSEIEHTQDPDYKSLTTSL